MLRLPGCQACVLLTTVADHNMQRHQQPAHQLGRAWLGRAACAAAQALLGLDGGAGADGEWLRALVGSVMNVNFPAGASLRGLYLAHQARRARGALTLTLTLSQQTRQLSGLVAVPACRAAGGSAVPLRATSGAAAAPSARRARAQGSACVFPAFKEVFEELGGAGEAAGQRRLFRNTGGGMQWCGPPVPGTRGSASADMDGRRRRERAPLCAGRHAADATYMRRLL
jgi:hypothetical protein